MANILEMTVGFLPESEDEKELTECVKEWYNNVDIVFYTEEITAHMDKVLIPFFGGEKPKIRDTVFSVHSGR